MGGPARPAGTLSVRTGDGVSWHELTDRVREIVAASGVGEGSCLVASLHTTCGVLVNENADPDVMGDLVRRLDALVPADARDRHAEGNTPAHVKAVLVGSSVTLPVRGGDLALGRWQGVFLVDFDGPRERRATVTVLDASGA